MQSLLKRLQRTRPAPIAALAAATAIVAIVVSVMAVNQHAEAQAASNGICHRTQAIQDAIIAATPGTPACADVTGHQLATIAGTLDLSNTGMTDVRSHDFEGLSGVETLDLSGNGLTGLYPDLFTDMTALQELDASDNDISYVGNPFDNNAPAAFGGPLRQQQPGNGDRPVRQQRRAQVGEPVRQRHGGPVPALVQQLPSSRRAQPGEQLPLRSRRHTVEGEQRPRQPAHGGQPGRSVQRPGGGA